MSAKRCHRLKMLSALMLLLCCAASSSGVPVDFAREVRPIFEKHCYECHGPEKRKSGYRLDVRDIALRGGDSGEVAIVPHDAKRSPLIRYVSGDDEEMLMPPKKSKKERLSTVEVATLRAWIDAGPAWPDELAGEKDRKPQWSLTPLTKPAVPGGEANPIDAFVRAKLAEKQLAHAPEADRRTLIRRVTFDLTGLPPTPEETDAFIGNKEADAYEKLVDRLLASPRHGEHWARHWLDVANYADTHGNDHDYARPNAWPYRDYVIRAFNDDKPYERFVQEQVAGDALFPGDPQATVALGFMAAGPWDHTLMVTVRADTVDRRVRAGREKAREVWGGSAQAARGRVDGAARARVLGAELGADAPLLRVLANFADSVCEIFVRRPTENFADAVCQIAHPKLRNTVA